MDEHDKGNMMLTKFAAPLLVAVLAAGALGVGPPPDPGNGNGNGPGPNGFNNFGLCTAYFAGSDQGQDQKKKAPPFQALEQEAEDWAEEEGEEYDSTEDAVAAWCDEHAPHPSNNGGGNGGGNPNS